jgi:hypothetical protein
MTVVQTVLVFVAIPLGVVLLITFAVYGRAVLHQPNRYRPGRPWQYPPAWFVPHPDAVVSATGAPHRELESSGTSTTAVGGASGEW